MGLGETTNFATRNLRVSGDFGDNAFTIANGTVDVVPSQLDPELGVVIFFEANDGEHVVDGTIDVAGNLGALCPGASVELARDAGRLVAVGVAGAPPTVLAPLMGLEMEMSAQEGAQSLVPDRVVMTSSEAEDGFSEMHFEAEAVVGGEPRVIRGTFEIARVVEDTEAPGWEGDTWDGMPIAAWE